MKWFRKWLKNMVQKAHMEDDNNKIQAISIGADVVREINGPSLRFEMYFAEGGVILQRNMYDHIKDRHNNKLYLITDNEDVATRVGEIVALEIMRGPQ